MSSNKRTISNLFIGICSSCILLVGCFVPTTGCLDSNARNFDVYADDDCCCTYPIINVGVFQSYESVNHGPDSIYTNSLGQQFQITEQAFYLSDLYITYEDNSISDVLDTLEVEIPLNSGNLVLLEDNFALVTETSAAFSPGDIATNGSIAKINFNIGLTNEANMLIPSQLPTTHPLGSNNDDFFVDGEGYIFYKWSIKVLNVSGVTEINLASSGSSFLRNVEIAWPSTIDKVVLPGSSTTIPLQVNYDKWLEGIDFAADITTIQALIAENTDKAFEIGL